MSDFGISPDDLHRLARLLEENGLSELRYQEGDLSVTLRTADAPTKWARGAVAASAMTAAHLASDAFAPADLAIAPPGPSTDMRGESSNVSAPSTGTAEFVGAVRIDAPVMGVFYRAAAPGEPPLVEVGDAVSAGQPVGLIEAMKVFSEVLAESPGIVRAIPAKNGALVQPGDPLVVLEGTEL